MKDRKARHLPSIKLTLYALKSPKSRVLLFLPKSINDDIVFWNSCEWEAATTFGTKSIDWRELDRLQSRRHNLIFMRKSNKSDLPSWCPSSDLHFWAHCQICECRGLFYNLTKVVYNAIILTLSSRRITNYALYVFPAPQQILRTVVQMQIWRNVVPTFCQILRVGNICIIIKRSQFKVLRNWSVTQFHRILKIFYLYDCPTSMYSCGFWHLEIHKKHHYKQVLIIPFSIGHPSAIPHSLAIYWGLYSTDLCSLNCRNASIE